MGLTEEQFFDTTPRFFFAALKANNEKEYFNYKTKWEQVRMIAYYTSAPHLKKGFKPKDIIKFDWEVEKKTITDEDVKRIKKIFKL